MPEILSSIVDENDGELVLRLLSILDTPHALNNYLAGYFEKMMELLLRTCTTKMIDILNRCGLPLFRKFVLHLDNYSVMQVAQRLLLPHIPFAPTEPDVLDDFGPLCDWADQDSVCEVLCQYLSDRDSLARENGTSHASDLLITVLQLSPAESLFISNLCSSVCLDILASCALSEELDDDMRSKVVRTSALSVLESLISRLCDIIHSGEPIVGRDSGEPHERTLNAVERVVDSMNNLTQNLKSCLNQVILKVRLLVLSFIEKFESKSGPPRLGLEGLQTIRLMEAIIRVADSDIDTVLAKSDSIQNCLALLFACESHSLLHMSVQRMLCMIVEGGENRW